MVRFIFLATLLAWGSPAFTQLPITLPPANFNMPEGAFENLTSYDLVRLDTTQLAAITELVAPAKLNVRLGVKGQSLDFLLYPYDQRTDKGARPTDLFRSAAADAALFTFDDRYLMANWRADGTTYYLEPLWANGVAAPRDVYVYYAETDVAPLENFCGGDHHGDHDHGGAHTPPSNPLRASVESRLKTGGCLEVDIALVADFELFSAFGNVASTENFMLTTLADVQTNYDDEFDDELQFLVSEIVVAQTAATSPWPDSFNLDLLNSFTAWGQAGNLSQTYDVAALWSNTPRSGSAIGIAWLGAMCTNSRYNINAAINGASSRRVLWAHELGHNFGANHSSNGTIMAPMVNNSTTWSAFSLNQINDFYPTRNCFAGCDAAPVAAIGTFNASVCEGSLVPFADNSQGRVDSRQWTFTGGVPATSSDAFPVVNYPNPGLYPVSLEVTNALGTSIQNTSVRVGVAGAGGTTVLLYENFENGNNGFQVRNPDGRNTWVVANSAGNGSDNAIQIDNFSNNRRGQTDSLLFEGLDFRRLSTATLSFQHAYRRYSPSREDELRVIVRGTSRTETVLVANENGSGNFATGFQLRGRFVPSQATDWCIAGNVGADCFELDLIDWVGDPDVDIIFVNENGFGNVLYLDNVELSGDCQAASLPVEWLDFTVGDGPRKGATLNWSVNQDELHAGFTVQRRLGTDTDWQDLGRVPTTGGAGEYHYHYDDDFLEPNRQYFYRLRQEDLNGMTDHSVVRAYRTAPVTELSAFPNPTNGLLTVRSPAAAYSLHDATGRRVRAGRVLDGRAEVGLENLPAGVYVLRAGRESLRVVRR